MQEYWHALRWRQKGLLLISLLAAAAAAAHALFGVIGTVSLVIRGLTHGSPFEIGLGALALAYILSLGVVALRVRAHG